MPGPSTMPALAMPSVKRSTALVLPPVVGRGGVARCSRSIPCISPPLRLLVVEPGWSSLMASIALLLPPLSIGLSGRRVSTVPSKLTIASESADWRPLFTKKLRVCFIVSILAPLIEPERSTTATISKGSFVTGRSHSPSPSPSLTSSDAPSEIIASSVCASPALSAGFSADAVSDNSAGALVAGV
eukprot:scaffold14780_cov72-Phaeocystis_antarctica.AAC.5